MNTNGTPVSALQGYHIYYGATQGTNAKDFVFSIAVTGAATTSYEITGLWVGTWYFAVAADTADGSESALSEVGSKTIGVDVDGIAKNGTPVLNAGLDEEGNAYSSTLLGTSTTWAGMNFSFATSGTSNASSDETLMLSQGNFAGLYMLATGVNGNQPDQTFTVTYTDGTTTQFTRSLSDWVSPQNYPGESKVLTEAYRLKANGTTDNRPFYVYGYALPLNSAKTVRSLTLPTNRNVVMLSYDLSTTAPPASLLPSTTAAVSTSVSIAAAANVHGLVDNGAGVPNGGLDGLGNAYSETLLGNLVAWSGGSFSLGTPGAVNAASATTVTLPAGNFSKVLMLATGVRGNQVNQTFVVTYTDGTTTRVTQSLSDWFTPQNYAGETKAFTEAYRLLPNGTQTKGPFYLYGYSLAINSAKTVKSLTLPTTRDVVVVALAVSH